MDNSIKKLLLFGKILSRIQFDAYCFCRQPQLQFYSKEIEWYSFYNNKLLAVIIWDFIDNDYGFVILGRDENRLFRCIEVSEVFKHSLTSTRHALYKKIKLYELTIKDCYPQGVLNKRIDLFKAIIDQKKQHKFYKILAQETRFEAARNLITEIANSFIDSDGHFEKEFQSNNFHSRLWELYLHMYFNHNMNLNVLKNHYAPDFELSYFGEQIFVEATTVNPSESKDRPDPKSTSDPKKIQKKLKNFMPIKFGSALLSKLNKNYWEKSHVKNHPLIFAIHDYHNDDSMIWSRTALVNYLYGIDTKVKDGTPMLIKKRFHKWKGKKIESGFFYNATNSKFVSAVLFSNQATLTKFNRMGKLAGLGSNFVKMIRVCFLFDPDPNAFEPIMEYRDLDSSDYEESWSEGLVMYHNPNAVFPIPIEAFNDISHVFYDDIEGLVGISQPYEVLNSITYCFSEK
ncbi:TPA: hypothetical protein ACSH5C_001523 [Legionella pneumophila]|nr:hypothetical protein [Legionella pneumophila]